MPFLLEDGTGVAGANAYITATEMRAYWEPEGRSFAQNDAALQVAIVKATRYLERRYAGSWKGLPTTETQTLAWPRSCVYNQNTYPAVAYDPVPQPLKDALAVYAERALDTELTPDPTTDAFVTMTREKVGPIETEEQRLPGVQRFTPIPEADLWLRPLLATGSYVYR